MMYIVCWTEACLKAITMSGITYVILSSGRGWKPVPLDFLRTIPLLTGLEVRTSSSHKVAVIEELKDLEILSLEIPFAPTLDLTRLPKLKECSMGCYSSGLESVFRLTQLERLYLDELRIEEFPAQSWLSLEVLRIKSSTIKRINLDCPKLTDLRLGGTKGFRNFTDLRLPALRKLTCAECKNLESLNGLEGCEQLQELEIDDCGEIESLAPLSGLTTLSTLRWLGNTTIRNGDLSMLKRLPVLKRIELVHRPHYSHRLLFGRLFP